MYICTELLVVTELHVLPTVAGLCSLLVEQHCCSVGEMGDTVLA